MKQHIISPEASQDLEEIIDYFTNRNNVKLLWGGHPCPPGCCQRCRAAR